MSYIPNCRTDENYNEKFLSTNDKEFVAGYDYAVEQIKNLFYNLDVYPDLCDILSDNKAIIAENKAITAMEAVGDWAEMNRNELITGIIDGMDEGEYQAIKESVLKDEAGHSETQN